MLFEKTQYPLTLLYLISSYWQLVLTTVYFLCLLAVIKEAWTINSLAGDTYRPSPIGHSRQTPLFWLAEQGYTLCNRLVIGPGRWPFFRFMCQIHTHTGYATFELRTSFLFMFLTPWLKVNLCRVTGVLRPVNKLCYRIYNCNLGNILSIVN